MTRIHRHLGVRGLLLLGVGLALLVLTGCPPDYEGDEPGECDDGADNDQDGAWDCDDPDCAGAPECAADDDDATDDDDVTDDDDAAEVASQRVV